MSFPILVLQSIRYAILALALKLFNYAEFIDHYCVRISRQLEHHDINTSRTASCRPEHDSSHNQQPESLHILRTPTRQSEDLHGNTGSSTSNDWSGTKSENHKLASDQSSCSSIGSIASTPESTSKLIVSPTQDVPTSVHLSDISLSAEGSLCLSKPIAFSLAMANARKAAPARHGNLFSDEGDICGLGRNDHGVNRGVAATNASSSGGLNEPLVFHLEGTSVIPFTPTIEKDTATSSQRNAYQSITAMQAYNKYSFEELRFADYDMAINPTVAGEMRRRLRIMSAVSALRAQLAWQD
jgi:hypothetical protein